MTRDVKFIFLVGGIILSLVSIPSAYLQVSTLARCDSIVMATVVEMR